MRIVHSIGNYVTPQAKQKRPTKREERTRSSLRWMELQEQADYRKALKEYEGEIKEIRDLYDPTFKPVKV